MMHPNITGAVAAERSAHLLLRAHHRRLAITARTAAAGRAEVSQPRLAGASHGRFLVAASKT